MKTLLVLPYFGRFPNYFNLHLHTIKYNKNIDWLLITDDQSGYDFPSNVTVVYKTFEEIRVLFQSKFNFEISLDSPFKLCDFRPAFGYVFEDYLKGYDFWGHCDPDILWGNFNNFLDFTKLNQYDKIFSFGHLTLYKNEALNNQRFREPLHQEERYKTVFSHPIGFAFDEKFDKSINTIYKENNFSLFTALVAADIDSYHSNMRLSLYDFATNSYSLEALTKQLFVWEEGRVYRFYIANGLLVKQEFLYIHLQKRKMKEHFNLNFPSRILITLDAFVPLHEEITLGNFDSYYRTKWFNTQFFKVKWNSFKYKLKYKDYFYGAQKSV